MDIEFKLISNETKQLLKILERKNIRLFSAESFTGGLFSSYITSIPGASKTFILGMVTYSDKSKKQLLDIPDGILKENGSVSEEVSILMARNIIKNYSYTKNFISVSSTGVAGPDGGSDLKPVGTTYFSFNYNGKMKTVKKTFNNLDRTMIRIKSVELMIKEILKILKNSNNK
tara:strand:- start:202 stop:720 length:519 start_codon:yes stop_codon:yes gene_type:complete